MVRCMWMNTILCKADWYVDCGTENKYKVFLFTSLPDMYAADRPKMFSRVQ